MVEDTANGAKIVDRTTGTIQAVNYVEDVLDDLDGLGRFYDEIFEAQSEINEQLEEFLEQLRWHGDNIDGGARVLDDVAGVSSPTLKSDELIKS